MSISVGDNFSYLGEKPLDNRIKFATVADMAAMATTSLYDGILAYVVSTKMYYTYDSTNTADPTLGKWREYKGISDFDDLSNRPSVGATPMTDIIDPIPVPQLSGFTVRNNMILYDGKPFYGLDNINYYVNPSTGVDNFEGGYGLTGAKPFKTLDYAVAYAPVFMNRRTGSGQTSVLSIHMQGTFTSSTGKDIYFEFPNYRAYLYIDAATTFNNIRWNFLDCAETVIRLNGANLTFNCNLTNLSSSFTMLAFGFGTYSIDAVGATSSNQLHVTMNGNSTSKSYIYGANANPCALVTVKTANTYLEGNDCQRAFYAGTSSKIYVADVRGSGSNQGIWASEGGIFAYGTAAITATTKQGASVGGRVYTGNQSSIPNY